MHPALETAQRAAQPADAHTKLVNMFDELIRITLRHADGVARDVRQAFIEDEAERLGRRRLAGVARPASLAYRWKGHAVGQAVAAFGLAARLVDEPEPLAPIGETVDVGDSPINKAPH